jgi:glucosamine--fructose-6-phosphate aminotransferase (isomerizing)
MKSLGNFPDRFLAEIAGQPDAIRRALRAMSEQATELAAVRDAAARADTVLFTGMGSSYDACYAPVTVLAGGGVRVHMVDAAELLHFRLPTLTPSSLVIAVSQSGESAELVRMAESLTSRRPGPLLVSVTNGLGNSLAAAADVRLDTRAGDEEGPSTMTFAATLVALRAIAESLGGPPADSDAGEQAAEAVEHLIDGAAERAAGLREWLGTRPTLALLARGAARPAAEMGALTLKEAARFPAESLQTAQFRHGPLELAGGELAAIVMACEPATRVHDLGLAGELAAAGSAVLVVGPGDERPDGVDSVAIGEVERGLVSAAAIVPAQLLAWALANARGLIPGTYTVARKVTTRE